MCLVNEFGRIGMKDNSIVHKVREIVDELGWDDQFVTDWLTIDYRGYIWWWYLLVLLIVGGIIYSFRVSQAWTQSCCEVNPDLIHFPQPYTPLRVLSNFYDEVHANTPLQITSPE